MRHLMRPLAVALAVAALLGVAACGGDSGEDGLSPTLRHGRSVAAEHGCTSCHGADGSGGVGPSWKGLADSQVELADGSSVVADTAYLKRSINDPAAQLVSGYQVSMPTVRMSEADVDAIIAYIQSLKAPA